MVLVPETRFEAFLAKIAGETGPDLEPITRIEAFLDDIADGENNLEPRTRIEYWLQKIAENGGGGGGTDLEDLPWVNLWTNPAPSDPIGQTEIHFELPSVTPKYYRVVYSSSGTSRSIVYRPAGTSYQMTVHMAGGLTTTSGRLRTVIINLTNLTISISDCKTTNYTASVVQVTNAYMIPVSIDYIS